MTSTGWKPWALIPIGSSHSISVHHVLELDVLPLSFDLVEIFDSISGCAELNQHHRSFFDGYIPIILQVKHQLPYRKGDKLGVFPEEIKVFRDFHGGEVVWKTAERPKNVETAGLWLRLLGWQQVHKHRQHNLLELDEELLVDHILCLWVRLCLLEVSDVDLEHWADQPVADRPDVAPGWVECLLHVGPQLEDQVKSH